MAIITIFLDLDGVLADFDRHAHEQDKVDSAGKMKWDALDEAWWASMPAIDGAREFYDAIKKLATAQGADVKFLSAPTASPEALSGKGKWVMGFLPERKQFAIMDLILCPSKNKELLAGQGRILIDDRLENITAWQQAGGIGIHFNGDYTAALAALAQYMTNPTPQPSQSLSAGHAPKPAAP